MHLLKRLVLPVALTFALAPGLLAQGDAKRKVAEAPTAPAPVFIPATPVPAPAPAPAPMPPVEPRISDVAIRGMVEGENIRFQLDFTAECEQPGMQVTFVSGDVALEKVLAPEGGYQTSYDPDGRRYVMRWPAKGTYKTSLTFAARPKLLPSAEKTEVGAWREVQFELPSSRMRDLEVVCDRADLEVRFPGALRVTREVKDSKLTMKAILGPGLPFAVRWKPQVEELAGALVLACDINTIASVRAGAMKVDSLYLFEISQGKLRELTFAVPKGLSITQVRGSFVRDWSMDESKDAPHLKVTLNRPVTNRYVLQVVSELSLGSFPMQIEMPVLQPEGVIRSGGHLALGTDSAIHLLVGQTSGLSQTEPNGFPKVILNQESLRAVPSGKAFFYSFASTPYKLPLALDDIVPSYDSSDLCVAQVREDELSVETQFELDVRDAPLRDLVIEAPSGFTVAAVTGEQVLDYAARPAADKAVQEVVVHFKQPVLGRALVRVRLELGRSPLDSKRSIAGIAVHGAKSERGFVIVSAERSVQVETPVVNELLREVTAASVPVTVPDTQFAYRYRDRGWSLELASSKKPAGLMAESFHLVSLGDGVLYGYVVVNYVISGAPVDELRFHVPKEIENVEFVGGDIRNPSREGDIWVVKLQRKVLGDYNLAVSYSHPWKTGEPVTVGGIECEGMERRSGFICVSSRLNLQLLAQAPDPSLLEIKNEEIPPNYRLLLNAPILKAYKYVAAPHKLQLKIETYERTSVLPAVIELMELKTELNITDAGATESVTRIRYKVKNASDQFLTLSLPERATVWSTRLIERDPSGTERATDLTTSLDAARNVMMVPLKRLRDPNTPMTIELVYGQEHPEIQGGGKLNLAAPMSPVQTAYALWTVTAPKDWAALPSSDGNMAPKERRAEYRDLGDAGWTALASWGWAFSEGLPPQAIYYAAGVAVLLGALLLVLRGRWIGRLALAAALLALLWVGVRAASAPEFNDFVSAGDLHTMTYTRALGLDDSTGMSVAARVTPAWRRDATFLSSVIVPLIGLVLIFAALRYGWARKFLLTVGAVCVISAAARFPVGARVLLHVFTWGAPALLILWLAPRVMLPVRRAIPAAAMALLLAMALLPGCSAMSAGPLPERTTVDRALYELTAEKDSMKVTATLHVSAPAPTLIPLSAMDLVLLSKEKISEDVELVRHDGAYSINIKKKGVYDLKLEFLYALPEAGENQVRHFRMAVPSALTSQVELRIPDKEIEVAAPTAVSFTKAEADNATVAKVLLGPGDPVEFVWKPRARERSLETTSFYADVLSLVRFDTGLARGRHRIRLQIAQGEIKGVRVRAPENMTVTAVEGENLGSWRFNAETHEMEARLAQPAGGEYVLTVTTQITVGAMPATIAVSPLQVLGATNQREVLGLTASAAVQVTPMAHGGGMNVDDFAREAAGLTGKEAVLSKEPVRYVYRLQSVKDTVSVETAAVQPEIRSTENATFTVSDERLLYNGEIRVSVAKAGVFSLDLSIPEGYDIDTLVSPEMSHWDEAPSKGRVVTVHFRNKLMGETVLKVALSRPVGELPEEIAAPRIAVSDSLKHSGQVSLTSSRNVRLSVKSRSGVSELNVLELGIRTPGALAFSLLRPDWELTLKTEVVKPRVNVEFLHVAEVSDGIVRHTHYLRYRFYNAGQKILEVRVPKGALGLEISGPDIAHLKESEPGSGLWRIELARRQYDDPYLLKLRFETQYDRAKGDIALEPSIALNVDLQRGNVVAYSTDRVELAEGTVDAALQPADPRSLPRTFGAGDLSGAAFCYLCSELPYRAPFRATRHAAAALLEATVLQTDLETVLSDETGETITRAHLRLRVGSKRHLEVRLPAGAQVWSLNVNQRSEVPSRRRTNNDDVLLIPLAQAAAGDLPVEVDLIYVVRPASGAVFAHQVLSGPEFDLPLQQVRWRLFLPERYKYTHFKSTLNVNEETLQNILTQTYDAGAYEERVIQFNLDNRKKALELQAQGNQLAQSGKQQEARQAFSWANGYAFNDPELDEDTRVQLHSLMRDQAVVGIVGRRGQIRQQKGEAAQPQPQVGTEFDQSQAERVRNSLNRDDNANLETIIRRLIEMQEVASQSRVQLMVNAPLRGRVIELTRALQVKPDAKMNVSFEAQREVSAKVKLSWLWAAGLAVLLLLVLLADRALANWRRSVREAAVEPAVTASQPAPETESTTDREVE